MDDHAGTRQWLRSMFSSLAHEICESTDGTAAVRAYSEQQPDWVLMDIEMLPMNGLTATRLITDQFPSARIVVVTSHNEPGLQEAALQAGALRFLNKENLWQVPQIISELTNPQ